MITATVHFQVDDRMLRVIESRLKELGKYEARVGWFEDGPLHKYRDDRGQVKTSPTITVGMVAAVHELGDPAHGLVKRPIMKRTVEVKASRAGKLTAYHVANLYRAPYGSAFHILQSMGNAWKGHVQDSFMDGSANLAPLKYRTVARKNWRGAPYPSTPLVDTEHLRESCESRVFPRGAR